MEGLRAQIFASSVVNAHLADDDFRIKYGLELAMCQSVERDISGLQKVSDDTSIARLQLETKMGAL